jgi:hypothetical protein
VCLSSLRTGNYERHCSGFPAKDGIRIHPDGRDYLWVDESKIRSSATFSEVWNIDDPENGRSARRWHQKWGRLNETIFRVEFHDLTHPEAFQEENHLDNLDQSEFPE